MRIEGVVWLNAIVDKLAVADIMWQYTKSRKCSPTIPSFVLSNGNIVKTKISTWRWGKQMPGAM